MSFQKQKKQNTNVSKSDSMHVTMQRDILKMHKGLTVLQFIMTWS